MVEPVTAGCRYQTSRLDLIHWARASLPRGRELPDVVIALLTEPVTAPLPAGWQGPYDHARAATWITELDSEATVLLATRRTDREPVGLLILTELPLPDDPQCVEVRVGYLIAENAWGQGLATELVDGFVGWCRATAAICSIVAGVAEANVASARTLTNNGFVLRPDPTAVGDQRYELRLRD